MLWRGTFLMLIGQALALLSGYGIQVFLARQLEPAGYGTFGVVHSVLLVIELIVVAGVPNALKRFVGENPAQGYSLHRVLFRWQLWISGGLFLAAFAAAPWIAAALQDESLTIILRFAVVDILFFGLYWYYNGFLTGQRRFGQQTLVVSAYTISKFVLVVVLVSSGLDVIGAFIANFLASFAGLIVGFRFFSVTREELPVDRRQQASFIGPAILYSVGLNLFFYIDLWFVKSFAPAEMVGYYNVAGTLGRMPYFFSTALSGALLPSLSFAIAAGDKAQVRKLILQSLRVLLLVLTPALVIVTADAAVIVRFLFGEAYLPAAGILKILFTGMCALTFFSVLNAVNIARRGMLACGLIVLGIVAVDVALNAWLVPTYMEKGAALATTVSMVVALVLSAALVIRQFGIFLPALTILRIAGIGFVLYWLAIQAPAAGIVQLGLKVGVLFPVYLGLLLLSREIGLAELKSTLAKVRSKLRPRGKGEAADKIDKTPVSS